VHPINNENVGKFFNPIQALTRFLLSTILETRLLSLAFPSDDVRLTKPIGLISIFSEADKTITTTAVHPEVK